MERDGKKIQKLEQKLEVSLRGYMHKLAVAAHTGAGEAVPGAYTHARVEALNKTLVDLSKCSVVSSGVTNRWDVYVCVIS